MSDKVVHNRHEHLSVFGIGAGMDANAWRSVVRQLVVQRYLKNDAERFGALALTERSRALLRGDVDVRLREDRKDTAAKEKRQPAGKARVSADDRDLWEALRACRQKLAAEHNVPPYVIFHDKTLLQMMAYRPSDPAQFLAINGVGAAKLERYGDRFLEVLREAG